MFKSQRRGLLIFALLCVATFAVTIWRSRTACERLGIPTPHPADFVELHAAPPAQYNTKASGSDTISASSAEAGKKPASKRKKKSGKHEESTGRQNDNERNWLEEL